MSQSGIAKITDQILPPDVPLEFVTDSGTAVASAHIINILGGAGATTSAFGNTIDITVTGTGFTWNVVTSATNPITLVAENGYIAKGASPVNFVLPAAASVGDTFWIKGYGNLWTLAQNALQTVSLGFQTTTAGIVGGMSATQIKDGIEIVCVTANLEFEIIDAIGNPTIT